MNMLDELLEKLDNASLARLDLPIVSRNPNRIARRLVFTEGLGFYWILLCNGLSCRACGFREKPVIRVERVRERDVLSDLVHVVPRVLIECCGRIVGRGDWRGSRIVLEDLDCDVVVKRSGVYCGDILCSRGLVECLEHC